VLQAEAPIRIAVVDLDVHQGDGTAAIFAGDDSVFTISLHGAKNFPFRKVESDLDVALADGCGDAEYLAALDAALASLAREHAQRPFGLCFYLAGADPHEGDRLGRLKVSAAGLLARDRRVLAELGVLRIPAALAMAGGYGHDLDVTVAIQAATIAAAVEAWRDWNDAAFVAALPQVQPLSAAAAHNRAA
jgi:acetoin utilization deacetylase AcuC-like enzyme